MSKVGVHMQDLPFCLLNCSSAAQAQAAAALPAWCVGTILILLAAQPGAAACRVGCPSCRPSHSRAQQGPLAVQGGGRIHALLTGGAARHSVAGSGVALAVGAGRDAHRPAQQRGWEGGRQHGRRWPQVAGVAAVPGALRSSIDWNASLGVCSSTSGSPGGGHGPLAGQDVLGSRYVRPAVVGRRRGPRGQRRPPGSRHACLTAQSRGGGGAKVASALHSGACSKFATGADKRLAAALCSARRLCKAIGGDGGQQDSAQAANRADTHLCSARCAAAGAHLAGRCAPCQTPAATVAGQRSALAHGSALEGRRASLGFLPSAHPCSGAPLTSCRCCIREVASKVTYRPNIMIEHLPARLQPCRQRCRCTQGGGGRRHRCRKPWAPPHCASAAGRWLCSSGLVPARARAARSRQQGLLGRLHCRSHLVAILRQRAAHGAVLGPVGGLALLAAQETVGQAA